MTGDTTDLAGLRREAAALAVAIWPVAEVRFVDSRRLRARRATRQVGRAVFREHRIEVSEGLVERAELLLTAAHEACHFAHKQLTAAERATLLAALPPPRADVHGGPDEDLVERMAEWCVANRLGEAQAMIAPAAGAIMQAVLRGELAKRHRHHAALLDGEDRVRLGRKLPLGEPRWLAFTIACAVALLLLWTVGR
jgi:hypothetical protein